MSTTPAVPCASCGTKEGSKRSEGIHVRYRGERFGFTGMLCASCRARAIRHEKARALGFEPGQVGRRPSKPNSRPSQKPRVRFPTGHACPRVADPTQEEIAERKLEEIREAERKGFIPPLGESKAEASRRRWAELAAEDRRRVAEARRETMAVGSCQR